ncbi:MAG: pyruvate kinase [Coriobacteriales bacterium]|nr:pyruvate kinase [Coriobacteriales bacterium]
MEAQKRTKIVCTVGPATEDDEVLRKMMLAGMDVARLNFSHGTHEYHRQNIERVRRIAKELDVNVAIMVDTKGPEIRTRNTVGHKSVALVTDERVVVTARPVESAPGLIALDYQTLASEVGPGDVIFVDDGLIGLKVERVDGDDIHCVVTNGGLLGEHKGVNIPNVRVGLPAVTDQDREDIRFSCEMQVDAIAASFVRDADAVREIRTLCEEYGAPRMLIISKIECALAVENIDEIVGTSNGIMVARGDLGVEIPPATVPQVQKSVIAKCNQEYCPVIVATQMLESMTHNPRPTRAEVTDVANAIYDGADCVMLSGETAAGKYPVEAVQMMAEVCRQAEKDLPERREYHDRGGRRNVSGATGYAAVVTAALVEAKAILCPTLTGRTARIMSAFRPKLPIIATSPTEVGLRRTCFLWGVQGCLANEQGTTTQICYDALKQARKRGLLELDDIVVITAGDPMSSPLLEGEQLTYKTSTNLMLIAQAM